jgi:hypothetical protein
VFTDKIMDQQRERPEMSERMMKLLARKAQEGDSFAGGILGETVVPAEASSMEKIAQGLSDPLAQAEEAKILAGTGEINGVENQTVPEIDLTLPEKSTMGEAGTNIEQQLDRYLKMNAGPNRDALIRELMTRQDINDDLFDRMTHALSGGETKRAEALVIPKEPIEYKKFMRTRIRKIIEDASSEHLSLEGVLGNLKNGVTAEMGFDPSRVGGINLFPRELGNTIEVEIKEEIRARVNLRSLELKEDEYKGADKNAMLLKYINDSKGSETNQANPSFVAFETYQWLKNIDSLDDPEGTTTAKVDKAMSLLLKLGQDDPRFYSAEEADFVGFGNIYDPKYDQNRKKEALGLVARECGEDARNLSLQLFKAFKEEGNYNKDHYLFVLFQFADARKNAALGGNPIGSRRVYMVEDPNHPGKTIFRADAPNGHEKEIPCLAKSPLRAQAKYGESNGKDLKIPNLHFERALNARFLNDLNEPNVKNLPDREMFTEVKNAIKVKTSIEEIGKLGESDKSTAIASAEKSLKEIRNSGQELVDSQAVTQEWMDYQLYREVLDATWEMSVYNPMNVTNLSSQSRQKPNFLLPSGLSEFFAKVGQETGKRGYRIIGDQQHFGYLRSVFQKLIIDSYNKIENEDPNRGGMALKEGDKKILAEQKQYLYGKKLPVKPGNSVLDVPGAIPTAAKTLSAPMDSLMSGVADKIPEELVNKSSAARSVKSFLKKPNF